MTEKQYESHGEKIYLEYAINIVDRTSTYSKISAKDKMNLYISLSEKLIKDLKELNDVYNLEKKGE